MTIRIIITGGTIDKEYDPKKQEFVLKNTHIKQMLREGHDLTTAKITKLMLKDSKNMIEKDYNKILIECKNTREKQVVITHGTDNMHKTAQLLGKNIKNKTIILTGALRPGTLEETDALFNLGGAIIAVQALPVGVYVAISGKIFEWHNVRKNKKHARFETIK